MEMKVITSYPVVMKGTIPMGMYDQPKESISAGNLKVETSYPVIIDGKDVSPNSWYSNANGSPSMEEQAKMKNKGLFWDRAKNTWQKIANNPASAYALQSLADYLAMKQSGTLGQQQMASTPVMPIVDTTPPPPMGMSKGTKIALVVGGVLVAGAIAYAIFAKKN